MNSESSVENIMPVARVNSAAAIAAFTALATMALLAALHFLSPEYDIAWRMVSEYALGNYGWVLSGMFACWAVSSWTLALALTPLPITWGGRLGWLFLVIAGVGMMLAAFFDVKHNLHGVAAIIGMPSLPVAAILISVSLNRKQNGLGNKKILLWSAHATWISLVILAITMFMLISGFVNAGADLASGMSPETLPPGVTGLNGYANRLLIAAYCCWTFTVAKRLINFKTHY